MSEARLRSGIPPRYLRVLLIRGVAIWALSRLIVLAIYRLVAASADRETAAAFTAGNPFILAIWTLALSASLVRVDLFRRREIDLLNNLGVTTTHAVVIGTLPAIVMESAMTMLR